MKTHFRWISILLSVLLICSSVSPVYAADSGQAYSPFMHIVDRAFGTLHDRIFHFLQSAMRQKDIPTMDDFFQAEHSQFYPGTDGIVRGENWRGGFASGSIIPTAWRIDVKGKPDPEGYRIRGWHAAGGYQIPLNNIYSDQMLNLLLLTCGSDANGNGVPDILIFASIDGVGLTADTVQKNRKAIENSLAPYGITSKDILACSLSATHCHNALDTQGMYFGRILRLMPQALQHSAPRSLDAEMEKTLCDQAAACAAKAFEKLEPGVLSFFETTPVGGGSDIQESGVKLKNWFSCFMFEGVSGEKTILANLAAHPVSYGKNYGLMLYADYPYYMSEVLEEAGVHLVFTQSAQASTRTPNLDVEPESTRDKDADAYVASHTLSKADWQSRYGKALTALLYDRGETYGQADFERHIKTAYLLAYHILDFVPDAETLTPTICVRNTLMPLDLDNGLLSLGSISGMLGERVMQSETSESGYAIAVELGLIELGNVTILTAPGELSPSMLLGSDPDYSGDALWTGVTSWTGEDWPYNTLEQIVRVASGNPEKKIVLLGLTNDAIGYVYPDVCVTQSMVGALFYKHEGGSFFGNMMLTTGTTSGSQLMRGYIQLVGN